MLLVVLLLLVGCVVVVVYELVRKRGVRWQQLSKFPGDFPLPLIGNALQLGFDADESPEKIMQVWRRHGKTNFRLTIGSEEWVLLCEPDDVGAILGHPTELSKTPERNAAMIPFFGHSVSTSEGEKWRSTRKLMMPSFHFKTQGQRLDVVNRYCKRLVDILGDHGDKGPVDMYRYLRPFMFDILCNTLMGIDSNLLENPDHPYLKASGKVIEIVTRNYFSYWRNITPLFVLSPIYREMMDTIKEIRDTSDRIIIKRRHKLNKTQNDIQDNNKNINNVDIQKLIKNKLSEVSCLLDSFLVSRLPNGDPTPDEIVNDEITLICFTGHYTTTKTMSHTLYSLAKYPHIQQKVLEEQRSIFNNNMTRNPTSQDLNNMKYLEAVIKESIRTIPTVPKIGRQIQEDLVLKDGRVIPAGSTVIVHYEALYLNDKVYPEPHKYKPERFFENMHQFAFVPFSAGPRNCIGFRYAWLAMKATLSNILRHFELLEGGPGTEPQFVYRIITESKNGIQLKLKRRIHS
uniref:Cytochrome P450 CYP405A9 n=1 Tax=Depressaria pastinacella TaxID=58004 RepID=A0A2Z6JNM0_DEPPA|nr:TPA_inf: cytochrome P450 CYP405A9 [Depressaria pastinacella]